MQFRTQELLTTALLGSNGVYTSPAINVSMYNHLRGKVYADQAGSLALQASDDGVNWDTLTTVAVTASTPAKFDEICYTNSMRIVYTNGATAQGAFRLSAYKDPFR